ncbi:MAG TPA: peptidylprolyl isomerase [Chthonomonadaceae bacterium]|nr:peptidylprolyl isomerase [Chthonomonadaceae bacterium]
MLKNAWPALLAASLWAVAPAPSQAQGANNKPAPQKPASVGAARPAVPTAAANSEVVASVDGKPITWDQLFERVRKENPEGFLQSVGQAVGLKAADTLFGPDNKAQFTITRAQALAALRQQPTQLVRMVLQRMLVEEALNQVAAREGVQLTDAQMNAHLTRLLQNARKRKLIPDNLTDDQFLTQLGYTRASFAATQRPIWQADALIEKDLEKTYGHPIGAGDFIQARHILISVPQPTPDMKEENIKKQDADALAKITQIAKEIKSGKKTFEQAAQENSDDPSKANGGDLGVFMRGSMVKPFEDKAFSLKPGEVSEPVRTQFGYHLIKVEKLGQDIPAEEREAALEQYDQKRLQSFIGLVMTQRVKVVNNMPQPPASATGPMMPGRPVGAAGRSPQDNSASGR